jgi:hypothetical protein
MSEVLRFLGCVGDAVNSVEKEKDFKNSDLVSIIATIPARGPESVSSPDCLRDLKVTFRKPTAIGVVTNTNLPWGNFGPVEVLPFHIIQDVSISWPLKCPMEPEEADKLMKDAGFLENYTSMELSQPIRPSLVPQPYYQFKMVTGQIIAVGLDDKKVYPIG